MKARTIGSTVPGLAWIAVLAAAAACGPVVVSPAPAHAAFPGVNGKLAFSTSRDSPSCFPHCGELYRMGEDGGGQSRLTSNATGDGLAAWSPDGHRIAFTSYRDGEAAVYLMNADGSGQTRLVEGMQPAWSPDGQKIAFASGRQGYYEIYVINVNGSGLIRLTTETMTDMQPAWSPDGQKIAFSSARGGASYEIYSMNTDGTGVTKLTTGGAVDPNWSPDGAKLAFRSQRGYDIYTINRDGSGQTRLTTSAGADGDPAWSPDGQRIAFTSNRGGNFEIYVMNSNGTNQTNRTNNGAQDTEPDWQPIRYATPLGASPLQFSLVPLFQQCGTVANPADGGRPSPFSGPSCNPPAPVSGLVRVGPQSSGYVHFTVIPGDQNTANGDQADVGVTANLSDVSTLGGADYTPNPTGADLMVEATVRLSDLRNGPAGNEAGTTTQLDFAAPIDCAGSADPAIGAACSVNSSADALVPGYIAEAKRTVFQFFRIRVNDPGQNAVLGDGDDRIFAHQGVYIP